MPFVSRPFRLVQLNALADALMRKTKEGLEVSAFIACVRTMQSLLHDIAEETASLGMAVDVTADGAALVALSQKHLRLEDLEQEQILDQEAELDRMLAYHERVHQEDL